jgi:hypothetical protein
MRRTLVAITLAFGATACARTAVFVPDVPAPQATIVGRSSFGFLAAPPPSYGAGLDPTDPMVEGSLAGLALRQELRQALEARGYRSSDEPAPDMVVAVYAAASQPTDFKRFDFGYASRPASQGSPRGTVIVDLVDPATHRLLWRGEGVAHPSDDANRQLARMESLVDEIAGKLPRAIP